MKVSSIGISLVIEVIVYKDDIKSAISIEEAELYAVQYQHGW
jgi:hypothetical protein